MKNLLVLISVLALSSCAYEAGHRDGDPADYRSNFGTSVQNNINAQIVNPNAPSDEPMTADGERVIGAQEAYKADEVEKPQRSSTRESSGEGGGSSE